MSNAINVTDRLRELIEVVVATAPGATGEDLATAAHYSRDHLDRLLAAATGETPTVLRRRVLLERAAWQLRHGGRVAEVAVAAGYGSTAAFSRAFTRAHGTAPTRHVGSFALTAPNGIHFHPPAGLLVPSSAPSTPGRPGLSDRMLGHHLARVRELLDAAATLPRDDLERRVRPGLVVVWFEGEEASAAEMLDRLVGTLEVWAAAIVGEPAPERAGPLDRASTAPAAL